MLEPLSNTQVMLEAPSSTQVTTIHLKGFLGVVNRWPRVENRHTDYARGYQ